MLRAGGLIALFAGCVRAAPIVESWPASSPGETVAVAAASLSGWYATADPVEDSVELRDVSGVLKTTITRSQISALLPWMDLNAALDGPTALCFSDSGRLLFVAVQDASPSGDAQPDDAILRYDTQTGDLRVFVRLAITTSDTPSDLPVLLHFRGRLYAGTGAKLTIYRAERNNLTASFLSSYFAQFGGFTGLAIDREQSRLVAALNGQIHTAPAGDGPPVFTYAGEMPGVRAVATSDHYGTDSASNGALYALTRTGSPATSRVLRVPIAQVRGQGLFAPTVYFSTTEELRDLAATADGRLLAATASPRSDAVSIRDGADVRLSYPAWLPDEFSQVVRFAKGLISPDGEPPGWVIDGDVAAGGTRFHPATPDGAAWTVLLLLMNDYRLEGSGGDPEAQALVRTILQRYAGRAPDGIRPLRSADGIYWHWLDPFTGGPKAGWGDSYATMSTMKIVLAAARARAFYPQDAEIRASADAIICGVQNWDSYFHPATRDMYLLGLAGGGPNLGSASGSFHEGVIFAEQAAAYGGASSAAAYAKWIDPSQSPFAVFVAGRPITGGTWGGYQAAFVSLYSLLLQADFRASPAWREDIRSLRLSNAAWTDDAGPKYFTVFSAGTTKSDWGGYNADSLGDHPGNVTTFTSLEAFAAGLGAPSGPDSSSSAEAVAAYNAYRRGARQTFQTGARMLYRRSDVDPAYTPNSAGLPDVALGALGLAELIRPGSVAAVLTGEYPSCSGCAADFNADGTVDFFDYLDFVAAFGEEDPAADFNGDETVDFFDYLDFVAAFEVGCE
jgi:hypothetical protein